MLAPLQPWDDPLLQAPQGEPLLLPPVDEPALVVPEEYEPDVPLDGPIISISPYDPSGDGSFSDGDPLAIPPFGYDPTASRIAWLPGHDDEFGIVSLENFATLDAGDRSGAVLGFGVHFLDGPVRTEMPARLYDFVAGYQRREWILPNFGWDFLFRVGAFSDFEGSAKDGVRFPSHVVTMLQLSPAWTWLLGVDYLDRDDVNLLPVVGAVWRPTEDLRFDLAFPHPRASLHIMDSASWLYVAGELGGGTWAIERDQSYDDNATYRDLRLVFGIETVRSNRARSAIELGYVFARELEYRSAQGDYSPPDCLMIGLVSRH